MYKNVLVIGADTFSTITDWNRRDAVFFGDGAGALVLSHTTQDKGFQDFILKTDGQVKNISQYQRVDQKNLLAMTPLTSGEHYFKMNGSQVYKTAIDVVPKCIDEILSKNNCSIDQIKYLLPHQPSIRILQEVARRVGLPFEKVKTNMDRYANTSGGTIPIILDETLKENTFETGDLLLFAAVGAGWTWGTALYKW